MVVTCIDGNETRATGETWARDACEQCTCDEAGRVSCDKKRNCKHADNERCHTAWADWDMYHSSTLVLMTLVLVAVFTMISRWYRQRGGLRMRVGTEYANNLRQQRWCRCATDQLRYTHAYNPVKMRGRSEMPARV
ncbi:hypothetical protein B566_EDAN004862 [Ephemera danica]|nr:hypothetical protein B566_EDAN004862 [Ephemera danica]